MEVSVARKRLEEMRDDLDRTVAVLQGEHPLARVDNGSYGLCVDCGKPVPEPRLEARPATSRCVPCQSKRDRRRR